jgi:hypothetical protein
MYYRINISRNGNHLFATADHSLTDHADFLFCLDILVAKFPKDEGYDLTATQWTSVGTTIYDRKSLSA